MHKQTLPTGTGYFDIDFIIPFDNFDIHINSFLNECLFESVKVSKENFFHLLYFQDGKINISFENEQYYIEPKTFVLYSSGLEHTETLLDSSSSKYHFFYGIREHKRKSHLKYLNIFQKESEMIREIFNQKKYFIIIRDTCNDTRFLFEKITNEMESNSLLINYSFFSIFLSIFINCTRSFYVNKTKPNYINYTSTFFLSSMIVSHLELNSNTITIKNLAEIFHISVRQVQRHINKFYGMTFTEKLNEIKIQNAKILLETSDLSISSIAKEVGYNQTSTFDRIFKSLEKTTPLKYRKSFSRFQE